MSRLDTNAMFVRDLSGEWIKIRDGDKLRNLEIVAQAVALVAYFDAPTSDGYKGWAFYICNALHAGDFVTAEDAVCAAEKEITGRNTGGAK